MRRMRLFSVFAVVVLLAGAAVAESAATADLHVTVRDPKGAMVTNANVTVRNEARNITRSTSLNTDGEYHFLLLPPGAYSVEVNAPGFAGIKAPSVIVTVGQRAEFPVTLKVASATEVENVTAEAALVETQRTDSSTTIDQVRIDNLPINGRNYINFALTNSQIARDTAPSIGAAPTSGLNFSGQRARGNQVNVDGADAVDNSTNGIRSTVSQEAVQEFQIVTNSYAPEYGRASGGVVNIITRSGTNAFHGTAFGYLRNRRFQAVNPFSTVSDPAYTRVQTGFTLGGPIIKDRTFYFLSYETTRRQETGFSTIGQNNFDLVPFPTALGTALLTQSQIAFIRANATNPALAPVLPLYIQTAGAASAVALTGQLPGAGPFFPGTPPALTPLPASFVALNSIRGNFPVSEGTSLYSLRLDHRLTGNQSLNLRAGVSPSTVTGIQVNAQGPQNFGQNAFSRTSRQTYRDFSITADHIWTIGTNKVNEFRFQAARRGLLYNFSQSPGGSQVGVQIPGFAFFGREPFSFVRRTEKRFQFVDQFAISKGTHNLKFGVDINHLPLEADFTVNFGGLFNFGSIDATSLGFPAGFPALSPVQAYGLGIPQNFIQGVGNPHDEFSNTAIAGFVQDSWRVLPNLTLNYGARYDVEFTPTFRAANSISQIAEDKLGITQGIPRDYNNIAPRIGLAWDPGNNGKTVVRAAYGLFYDHPLLGLAFDSDVADGTQAPQIVLFGGAPGPCSIANLNATNVFRGTLGCLPASFGYLPNEQRFNANLQNSIWVNQNYLAAGVPLVLQPFGFPVAKNFVYAYANQANLTVERDLGHNLAASVEYNFNGGRHLNRPINVNNVHTDLLVQNWRNVIADPTIPASAKPSNPLLVQQCGIGPAGPYIPAAVASFFRTSGLNPSFVPSLQATPQGAACLGLVNQVLAAEGLGFGVPIPFSDMPANFSNGSSVYHGLTLNLRKRMSHNYEFLASYTWSHTIDDSTDLQSPLSPQDNFQPELERSNSLFDQRHRFVLSGVYNTGKRGQGFVGRLLSQWAFAPIIDVSSGRPFNIIVGSDRNFDFGTGTDRPLMVSANAPVNACGDAAVPSRFSPTGALQPACFLNGTFIGNLPRNAGTRPTTVFTDLRISKRIPLTERVALDAIVDQFNVLNRFNVADVNPLYTDAGRPTAAFDPRQFQFALKLTW